MKKYCRFYQLLKTGSNILGEVYFSLTRDEQKEITQYMVVNVREEIDLERKWKALQEFFEFSKTFNHPSILTYELWGECKEGRYVATRCKEFFSLTATLQNLKKRNLPFSFDIPIQAVVQILSGLQYLSGISFKGQPIYHGLLSPDEIMIGLDGVVYIANYGILQILYEEDRKLAKDLILERSTFLPPELVERAKPSPATDVYSVAALLFYLLTGKPFSPSKDVEIQLGKAQMLVEYKGSKEIPVKLQLILQKALAPENERYKNIDVFRSVLEEFIAEEDITPTTFNLAYYMSNLFHDEAAERQKLVKVESEKVPVEIIEEPPVEEEIVEEIEEKKGFPLMPVVAAVVVVLLGIIIFLALRRPAPPPGISQAELEKRIAQLVEAKVKEREAQLRKEYEERYGQLTQQQQEEIQKRLQEERQKLMQQIRVQQIAQLRKQKSEAQVEEQQTAPSQQKMEESKPVEEQKTETQPAETSQPSGTSKEPQPSKEKTLPEETVKSQQATTQPPQGSTMVKKTPETPAQQTANVKKSTVVEGALVPLNVLDSKPVPVKKVAPRKPTFIRRSGLVTMMVLVSPDGRVEQVRIIKSLHPKYDEAARKAVMQWRFTSPMKDGKKVRTWAVVTIRF